MSGDIGPPGLRKFRLSGRRAGMPAPAAFGRDAEVGDGLRRSRDAVPPVAVVFVVVDDAEVEVAALGVA